ncbi:MAG: SDR family oxidoreductase [Alphaproteobacteria bacterium]|nr:SDR family oxidoreductase [Hyphomonas sp.]MBR9806029.1 SDR family oxidoreductase [Alphaproteobacteria bacterium]|tara:strand:+ start:4505 stop:5248 length:744 start_codon:yes stop_codon:yes gene_type:complete
MRGAVLITGCNGGIGQALMSGFAQTGWHVIGTDKASAPADSDGMAYVSVDLGELANDPAAMERFAEEVRQACGAHPLAALVNNAAVQHIGRLDSLSPSQILDSLTVNVAAPLLLARAFLPELEKNSGVILNIGSVHAQSTKPEFAAYATSKAALHGATRALAVDLGPNVRAITLAPAATATEMLMAGFEGKSEAFEELEACHPVGRIALPEEIAKLAVYLASSESAFLSGTTVYADGGVLSRLHDPV